MKSKLIYVFVALLITATACKKEQVTKTSDVSKSNFGVQNKHEKSDKANLRHGETIQITLDEIQKYNDETQRVIFKTVNASTRFSLWNEKLNRQLQMNDNIYGSLQKQFIQNLLNFITPDLFDFDIPMTIQTDLQIKDFERDGKILFPGNEIKSIMASLEKGGPANPFAPIGAGGPPCTCSTASDWCNFPVQLGGGCQTTKCEERKRACGTFWSYDCAGRCQMSYGN